MINSTLLGWSKKLIACPSVTTGGTRAVVELCARELLAPAGINAQLIPSAQYGAEQLNLVAVLCAKRADAPPLVLNTHLDTVAPGDPRLWTACGGDPFRPSLSHGRIYGLGAADTKLDFAAKALALIESPRPRRTVYLIATFGEESGLRGARELAGSGLMPRGALAFVGEPSGLALITANRGLNVFELHIEGCAQPLGNAETARVASFVGASAHSSTPHLGRNAIESALSALAARPRVKVVELAGGDAVNKVPALCQALVAGDEADSLAAVASLSAAAALDEASAPGELRAADENAGARQASRIKHTGLRAAGWRRQAIHPEMVRALLRFVGELARYAAEKSRTGDDSASLGLTCNAGVIRCAGERASLEFEMRQPPESCAHEITAAVEAIVDDLGRDFPGFKFELAKLRTNPGFRAAPAGEAIAAAAQAMAQAGLRVETGAKAGCTEAGVYAAVDCEPIVFGPGPSTGVIHAPNEYNVIGEVEAAARFYRCLLRL